MNLRKNIGAGGRILRFAIAVLLGIAAYVKMSPVLTLISLFVFLEALTSRCVLYSLLGINRCPKK